MADLGDDLRRLVDGAAEPVTLDEVLGGPPLTASPAPSRGTWHRWRWPAAAAVVLLVSGAIAFALQRDDDDDMVDVAQETARWTPSFGTEVAAPPVPAGWQVLDVGLYRFAVPADYAMPSSPSCAPLASAAAGVVLTPSANQLVEQCGPAVGPNGEPVDVGPVAPTRVDFHAPGTHTGDGEPATIGTLDVLVLAADGACNPTCAAVYELPDSTTVSVSGPDAEAILATFTDAGKVRALQDGFTASPAGWQPVTFEGVTIDVPAEWPLIDLPGSYRETTNEFDNRSMSSANSPGDCGLPMFGGDAEPDVSIGTARMVPSCPPVNELGNPVGDGAWLRSAASDGSGPGPEIVATGSNGGLTVRAVRYRADGATGGFEDPALDLLIDGPDGAVRLSVGVGDVGIARAIVHSIRPATATGAAPAEAASGYDLEALPDAGVAVQALDGRLRLFDLDGNPLGSAPAQELGGEPPRLAIGPFGELPEPSGAVEVPDGCTGAETRGGIRAALCAADESGLPTEISVVDAAGHVQLTIPPPPTREGTPTASGHWRWATPSPDGRHVLAQWSGECEVPIGFMVDVVTGELRTVDGATGTSWNDAPESIALGWVPDGRAVVSFLPGVCGSGIDAPGTYLVDPDTAERVLLLPAGAPGEEVFVWTKADLGNALERLLAQALDDLELEGCCGEPSHGGSGVTSGAVYEGAEIGISGSPVGTVEVGADGQPVPLLHGTAVVADGTVRFTCGAVDWRLTWWGDGSPEVDSMLLLGAVLVPHLGCTLPSA